jgi:hypothetical protein
MLKSEVVNGASFETYKNCHTLSFLYGPKYKSFELRFCIVGGLLPLFRFNF